MTDASTPAKPRGFGGLAVYGERRVFVMLLLGFSAGLPNLLIFDTFSTWLRDAGRPHHKEAAMAKLFATETAATVCDKAARVFASYGYAMEYPVQRYLRDVRFTLIGGGTSEILKLIIAKEVSS